jgi:hypothetical protein
LEINQGIKQQQTQKLKVQFCGELFFYLLGTSQQKLIFCLFLIEISFKPYIFGFNNNENSYNYTSVQLIDSSNETMFLGYRSQ